MTVGTKVARGFSVLILDDDLDFITQAKEYFLQFGIPNVVTVQTPDEADDRIRGQKFDVVLVDVILDELRGVICGDVWLAERVDELHGAMLAVVTAQPNSIETSREFLKQHSVQIVTKATPEEEQLFVDIVHEDFRSAVIPAKARIHSVQFLIQVIPFRIGLCDQPHLPSPLPIFDRLLPHYCGFHGFVSLIPH